METKAANINNKQNEREINQEKLMEKSDAETKSNGRSKNYDQHSIASSMVSVAGKDSTGAVGKGHISVSRQVTAADLALGKEALSIDAPNSEQLANAQISPAPRSQPIEAAVSILNPESNLAAPNSAISNGSSQLEQESSTRIMAKESASELKEPTSIAADRVSERAISVMPEVDCESANLQNNHQADTESGIFFTSDQKSGPNITTLYQKESGRISSAASTNGKRRSPDGQGGSQADILER